MSSADDYFARGEELFVKFVKSDESAFPSMFPRVPRQQYIDKISDNDKHARSNQRNDKIHQDNYEAEVILFRALERLKDQNLLVLHDVVYTHYQYAIWDVDHEPENCTKCQKTPKDPEGENDFIIFGPNYIVLFEVKNFIDDDSHLKELYAKTKKQLDRAESMIEGIRKQSLNPEIVSFYVLRFAAFPNSDFKSHEREAIPTLWRSGLKTFEEWWNLNICNSKRTATVYEGNFNKMKHALLALWATKHTTIIDKSEMNFSTVINAIDKNLRESCISFVRKNGALSSSNIVETATIETANINGLNIFKILKIEHITKEQQTLFEISSSKQLVITGCVGSGKSLILIARFLHKKLTQVKSKMALLVFNQVKLVEYEQIFKDANITDVSDINVDHFNPEVLHNSVVIIRCSTNEKVPQISELIEKLQKNYSVYIDDAHASSACFAALDWESLSVDLNQSHLVRQKGTPIWDLSKLDVKYLNLNYRSTPEIVSYLRKLSKHIETEDETQQNLINAPLKLLHHPSSGHFIHGPPLILDIWRNHDTEATEKLIKFLIGEFYDTNSQFNEEGVKSKVFILAPSDDPNGILKSFERDHFYRLIGVVVDPNEQNIYSTEFTACLILLQFSSLNTRNLRLLYNVFSRARVYCHIKLIVNSFEGDGCQTEDPSLKSFLSLFEGAKVSDHEYVNQ